ncbi:MAG: DUF58 domain-containing protein [Verrucomicrobiales bacterium]|nr:DUF58 domain-containing protein [Verrucomicrobiales bacterium]
MRFVPNQLLLWLTMLLVVPAMSLVVYDSGLLRMLGMVVLVALVAVAIVDLQTSLRLLKNLEVVVPDLVRCTKQKEFELKVEFANHGPRLPWIRYGISTTPDYRIEGPVIGRVAPLLSKKIQNSKIRISTLKRGQFYIEKLNVETPSKMGLWLIRRGFTINTEIRSYPDLSVERKKLSSIFLMRGHDGAHAIRQVGKGREFEQLREYQPGDDYIDIDWKATARRRAPVTRTYQIERTQEVYVIVDHSRFSGRQIRVPVDENAEGDWLYTEHGAGGEFAVTTQLERFLHCSLVLASVAEKQGDLFGFISFADKVDRFIRSRNGKQHYNVIRDALYTLEPSPVAPDYEQLMISLRQRLTRRALIVMLVDLSDPLTCEHFFDALPLISRQHLILVNMVRPSRAFPLFTGGEEPERTTEVYEKLAGHFQWQDLRETGRKLSHLGVELGVPDHEELCTEAVTQYLKVKQRQLI